MKIYLISRPISRSRIKINKRFPTENLLKTSRFDKMRIIFTAAIGYIHVLVHLHTQLIMCTSTHRHCEEQKNVSLPPPRAQLPLAPISHRPFLHAFAFSYSRAFLISLALPSTIYSARRISLQYLHSAFLENYNGFPDRWSAIS